ncbi:hypothetical protein AC1031_008468 [Aphanomyces cochlioides]|nr:hypothetical protein AC1031_008468 [Aphanomyces cochlioides]
MSGISIGASLAGAMPKESFKAVTSMAMHRVEFPPDASYDIAQAMLPNIVGHKGSKITAASVQSNTTLKVKIAKAGSHEKSYISVSGENVMRVNHGARLAQQLIDDAYQAAVSKKRLLPIAHRMATKPKAAVPISKRAKVEPPYTPPMQPNRPTFDHSFVQHPVVTQDPIPFRQFSPKSRQTTSSKPVFTPKPSTPVDITPKTAPRERNPLQVQEASKPRIIAPLKGQPSPRPTQLDPSASFPPINQPPPFAHHRPSGNQPPPFAQHRPSGNFTPTIQPQPHPHFRPPVQAPWVAQHVSRERPQFRLSVTPLPSHGPNVTPEPTFPTPIDIPQQSPDLPQSTVNPPTATISNDTTRTKSKTRRSRRKSKAKPEESPGALVPVIPPENESLEFASSMPAQNIIATTAPTSKQAVQSPVKNIEQPDNSDVVDLTASPEHQPRSTVDDDIVEIKPRFEEAPSEPPRATALTSWCHALTKSADLLTTHAASYASSRKECQVARRKFHQVSKRYSLLSSIHGLASRVPLSQRTKDLSNEDLKTLERTMREDATHAGMPPFLRGVLPWTPEWQALTEPSPFDFLDPLDDVTELTRAQLQRIIQTDEDLEEVCKAHEALVEAAMRTMDANDIDGWMHTVLHVCNLLRRIVLHRAATKEWLCRRYPPLPSSGLPSAVTKKWLKEFDLWRSEIVDAALPSQLSPDDHPIIGRTCAYYPYILLVVMHWTSSFDCTRYLCKPQDEDINERIKVCRMRLGALLISCKMPYHKLLEHERSIQEHVKEMLSALVSRELSDWAKLLDEHPELLTVMNQQDGEDMNDPTTLLQQLPGYSVAPTQLYETETMPPCQTLPDLAALAHQLTFPHDTVDV